MKNTIKHGGDREGFVAATGKEPLDFSINLNPLGIPESVVNAFCEAAMEARYPDPDCRELTAALAKKYGIRSEEVLCGNGASDLIFRYFRAIGLSQVLLPVPTFSEYPGAVHSAGGHCIYLPLREEDGFVLKDNVIDILDGSATGAGLFAGEELHLPVPEVSGKIDCLVLINPNNPTGRLIEEPLFWETLKVARDRNVRVFIDACFLPLTGISDLSYPDFLKEYPNVFILGAFTKSHAMAGMRLGYGFSADTELMGKMRESGPTWSVSRPAQVAGIAALSEQDYLQEAVELITSEREKMIRELINLGFKVIPSDANFLMFGSNKELAEPLSREGIMVRDLNNEVGIRNLAVSSASGEGGKADMYWYRVTVRKPEDNQTLLSALRQIQGVGFLSVDLH